MMAKKKSHNIPRAAVVANAFPPLAGIHAWRQQIKDSIRHTDRRRDISNRYPRRP